jgi:uncharacterized membrane protein YphA (DoxX/SURF4 family)
MNSVIEQKLKSIYTLLRLIFGVIPIAAGLDKFTNLLTDWGKYVNPSLTEIMPIEPGTLIMIIGIIEIATGILVLLKPRIGSMVVAAWLICIGVTLIITGRYLDVAVRDIVMAAGAFTLAKIAAIVEEPALVELKNFAEVKA